MKARIVEQYQIGKSCFRHGECPPFSSGTVTSSCALNGVIAKWAGKVFSILTARIAASAIGIDLSEIMALFKHLDFLRLFAIG